MATKHIWIIHTKTDPSNRTKDSGWTPMFKETSAAKAQNRVDQLTDIRKTTQLKVTKHERTTTGYSQEPLSETLIGRFERNKPVALAPKPKPKPQSKLEKMMTGQPHARRATKNTKPRGK
jgi:hypothetical protein